MINSWQQKTLLARGKQGWEIFNRFSTCLPPGCPSSFRVSGPDRNWMAQGKTHRPDRTGHDGSRLSSESTPSSASSRRLCSFRFSSNVGDD